MHIDNGGTAQVEGGVSAEADDLTVGDSGTGTLLHRRKKNRF
ncbi:MAG: hypothetical protein ACK5NG_01185 [Chthoniobacterales bacterium]